MVNKYNTGNDAVIHVTRTSKTKHLVTTCIIKYKVQKKAAPIPILKANTNIGIILFKEMRAILPANNLVSNNLLSGITILNMAFRGVLF